MQTLTVADMCCKISCHTGFKSQEIGTESLTAATLLYRLSKREPGGSRAFPGPLRRRVQVVELGERQVVARQRGVPFARGGKHPTFFSRTRMLITCDHLEVYDEESISDFACRSFSLSHVFHYKTTPRERRRPPAVLDGKG